MTTTRPAIGVGRTPDWRDRALCRRSPDWNSSFFPAGTTDPFRAITADTKEFCRACPVRLACAQWALTSNMEFGIWGGLDEDERRSIRRNHRSKIADPAMLRAFLQGREKQSLQEALVAAYLDRTEQDDQGHVRWLSTSTSITVAGRVLTPAQLAFEIGHGRRPDGCVKIRCDRFGCVAAEHLSDGRIRDQIRQGLGQAA